MTRATKVGAVGPQHLKALRDAQGKINDALTEIVKLESCGQDCQQDRQILDHYDRQIRRYLQVFFPEQ